MTLTARINLLYQAMDEALRRAEKALELAAGLRARGKESTRLYGLQEEREENRRFADRVWATNNDAADALEAGAANDKEVVAFHKTIAWGHDPDEVLDPEGRTGLVCGKCNEMAPCLYLKRLFRLYRIEVEE